MRPAIALAMAFAAAAAGWPPVEAHAHGVLRETGDTLRYAAADAGRRATLTISSPRPGIIEFSDSTSPGGIDWGPCKPLTERRARCQSAGVERIEVEVYDGDDRVNVRVPTPVTVNGGEGDDRLEGGLGADELRGGSGNDVIAGGEGADVLDGSVGDDLIRSRDGQADTLACGEGSDTLEHDSADESALGQLLDCESRSMADPAPDSAAPELEFRGPARQRLRRGRRVALRVQADEPARFKLKGTVGIGRRRFRARRTRASSDAPDQTVTITLRLGRRATRAARAAQKAGRRVKVRFVVTATDDSRNRSRGRSRSRLVG
jgi:hypothetical protein